MELSASPPRNERDARITCALLSEVAAGALVFDTATTAWLTPERFAGSDGQFDLARLAIGLWLPFALVALGAVIRGATPHADLINGQVSRSLAKIALDRGLPVINAVVCADTIEQAIERAGTKAGNKGWDGTLAALEMASVYQQLA